MKESSLLPNIFENNWGDVNNNYAESKQEGYDLPRINFDLESLDKNIKENDDHSLFDADGCEYKQDENKNVDNYNYFIKNHMNEYANQVNFFLGR